MFARETWVEAGEWLLERPALLGLLYALAGLACCARRAHRSQAAQYLLFIAFPFHILVGHVVAEPARAVWRAVPAGCVVNALGILLLLWIFFLLTSR